MKNIKNIIKTLLLLGLVSACTDLNSEMYDTINPNIFPKNSNDALSLLTAAAYAPFSTCAEDWSTHGLFTSAAQGIHVISDMSTDIGDCQWDDPVWPDMINVNFTSNSYGVTGIYADNINAVSKMTLTIDRIEKIDMDSKLKDKYIAELKCSRGWMSYILYDMYGPIQVSSLELLKDVTSSQVAPRLSKEEMVKYIEDNLYDAIKVLPPTYHRGEQEYGHFTRGLAYTVLLKLYMHEKNWKKAIECGKELQKPIYGYGLMEHYKDIFTLDNMGNREAIWSSACKYGTSVQMWLAHVLPSEYPTKNQNIQKWNGYRVPWSFYETFDSKDERLEVLIGQFKGTDGVIYNKTNPGAPLRKGAIPVKYGEDPDARGAESKIDWIVYRYADVLTLLAEAITREQNAVTQEAVDLLNKVHTRAGLAPYKKDNFVSKEQFLDTILLERGHELWFEGVRRSDLIRYGKYIEYAKKYKKSATAQDYMSVMPLPQSIINESKGAIKQNNGY